MKYKYTPSFGQSQQKNTHAYDESNWIDRLWFGEIVVA